MRDGGIVLLAPLNLYVRIEIGVATSDTIHSVTDNAQSVAVSLSLILRRSRTGTVWFYTSTSNKRAARPKLYTKSLTRDLKPKAGNIVGGALHHKL